MSPEAAPADLHYAFRVVAGDTPPTDTEPFTDLGHHRPDWIDKRCILQGERWVDRAGARHRTADMTVSYRANVLSFLRQEAAAWVRGSHLAILGLALCSAIDAIQANREIAALYSLPTGWTDHTPLGLALHRLNHTSPPPLQALPTPVSADTSDTPECLRNHDTGTWTVTTYSHSRYDIDLDRRRVRRVPAAAPNGNGSGKALPADGDWTPLTGIADCTIGRIMMLLDLRDGRESYRLSTTVKKVQATSPRRTQSSTP